MKPSEQECLSKWQELLARFSVLVENNKSPEKIRIELISLKNEAKNCSLINTKQKDMLSERVNNFISGRFSRK